MQDISDEIKIQLLKNRIYAAIECLEKTTTSSGLSKGFYDPDAKDALLILKGMKDCELNLSPDPNDFRYV
jgi:hypothetical protein